MLSSFHHSLWHILFLSAGRQLKRKKNSRNHNKSGALLSSPFCLPMCSPISSAITSRSCISVIFLPLPLTGNFCYFWLLPLFPLQGSPNRDCLCPTKTSLVSFPLGQPYPVKASKSKNMKRDKQSFLFCVWKTLRNGP